MDAEQMITGAPGFKSCPRVGGITESGAVIRKVRRFQVVPPCGGHRVAILRRAGRAMFQVVPPCGGHHLWRWKLKNGEDVSSRAPVWGASAF